MKFIKSLLILPFATGMSITISLLTLKAEKPVFVYILFFMTRLKLLQLKLISLFYFKYYIFFSLKYERMLSMYYGQELIKRHALNVCLLLN